MRGFLSLDPDSDTQKRLLALQNRLRDTLTRQGVHFTEPERLAPTLLAWPFGRNEELDEAAEILKGQTVGATRLLPIQGRPNDDRPGEIGCVATGLGSFQAQLFDLLKATLDPDPPKEAFIRLARISPPSRKVGAALRGSGLLGGDSSTFMPASVTIWRQTPHGFEVWRTMPLADGRP